MSMRFLVTTEVTVGVDSSVAGAFVATDSSSLAYFGGKRSVVAVAAGISGCCKSPTQPYVSSFP
jgi:hypothetical protein